MIDIRFKDGQAEIFVDSHSTSDEDPDTPVLSSRCVTVGEVEFWLDSIEKDIAKIRREAARKLPARGKKS
jgi:hypothetical protein